MLTLRRLFTMMVLTTGLLPAAAVASPIVFVDSATCESSPSLLGVCRQAGIKAWKQDEKDALAKAFNDIARTERGQKLIRALSVRPIRLYRVGTYLKWIAVADIGEHAIYFFDRRFDPHFQLVDSNYASNLAHEMAHLFDCSPMNRKDMDCVSSQKSFAKAARLKWLRTKDSISLRPKGWEQAKIDESIRQAQTLAREKNYASAVATLNQYAKTLHLPTNYALTSTDEMFAEIISASITDPEFASYTLPSTQVFVDQLLSR